ncbi:MAG: bifunctional riboflavin kinase/FAD synthetase [Proteobacteria bacterium]|nr:bifunctional riboflavin kinase/FAD synthetase [Pseudomonadota bacterium]
MRLVRHLTDLPFDELKNGSAVTIGAYDGLHLGHVQLLNRVIAASQKHGVPSVVMSFEPTPREFFAAASPPARLMRFREKFDALDAHGIDLFYCPRFDAQMRDITADAFIRRILIHGLCARHIVVGDDFKFASKREGTIDHLRRAGRALDYAVEQVGSIDIDGSRVSSTAIRDALWGGNLRRATALLGRPYRMSGKVMLGDKVGRSLGYPTANVDLRRRQSAVMGIFAVRVDGLPGGPKDAVASVGIRPTFDGTEPLLEVHIFDFDEEIYGEYIHVDFIERLRNEEKYDKVDDLVAQMHRDADNARSILAANTT